MNNNDKWGLKQYAGIGITSISVIVAGILIFFAIYRIEEIGNFFKELFSILQPIIFGLVIAYLLNPIMKWAERGFLKIFAVWRKKTEAKKKKFKINEKKISRGISVAFALVLAGIMLYFLLNMVIPELAISLSNMLADLPGQINRFTNKIQTFISTNELMQTIEPEYIDQIQEKLNELVQSSMFDKIENIMGYFAIGVKGVFSVLEVLMNFVIGIIVSVYVLCSKEVFIGQFKKLFYSVLGRKKANTLIAVLRKSDSIFSGFITGKIIDSTIIGILCFIGMSILKMPYAVLISVIVGVTNVIPFFGPYIGAIPSIFLILLVNPIQALYFAIFILVLQQLDGNIIGPKILGDSTGLSAFWVMFSILVGGGLFGFLGMVVGVPLCSVIFYLIGMITNSVLEKKNLPKDSKEYINIKQIDGNVIEYMEEKDIMKKKKGE